MAEEKNTKIDLNKILAAVSYLWIFCLLPLVLNVKNDFVKQHAKQGLVLFIAEIIIWILGIVPVLGWLIGFFGTILAVVFSVAGIIKALSGETWTIPFIGKYAGKIKI